MNNNQKHNPIVLPENFTEPTASFKKRIVLATAALLGFIAIYLGLMIWFGRTALQMFQLTGNGSEEPLLTALLGVMMGFLSIFMLKSLFIFKKSMGNPGELITEEDEPELFRFIYEVADEIGAPRPHKVFINDQVNASVFYDLSIWNLILPSKKNLLIGLGLVNTLSIGEFRAVLAHEFGHFAQKSMLLGRYVYTAQQVAEMVIHKRDALDQLLRGLSSFDLRVAWIGWILQILVWAVRSLTETIFNAVAIAEKAVSREMEFQADLVAVSVTGSDALVNGLNKLTAADEAYWASIDALNMQLQEKKAVPDMFALQSNYIDKMRYILSDPAYGTSPSSDKLGPDFRLFTEGTINPPQMWSTHPNHNDREANAKKIYIPGEIDVRQSWELFKAPKALREETTAKIIASAGLETTLISLEESIEAQNETLEWRFLDPAYAGVYFGRYSMTNFGSLEDVYDIEILEPSKVLEELYTPVAQENVEHLKQLLEEYHALRRVKAEVLTVEQRKIMFRGAEIKRREVPALMEVLQAEIDEARAKVMEHDRKCRKVPFLIAEKNYPSLAEYLQQLTSLLHYAEHSIADLQDAYGKYQNVFSVIVADGRISSSERGKLVWAGDDLHAVIQAVFACSKLVKTNDEIRAHLNGKVYRELFEPFEFPRPHEENLQDWNQYVPSWYNLALNNLQDLRVAVLEHLVEVEAQITSAEESGISPTVIPTLIYYPKQYETLMPGEERPLQFKLGIMDRFFAGHGIVASGAKFLVSALLIIATFMIANYSSSTELYIYNGLGTSVDVKYGNNELSIPAHTHKVMPLSFGQGTLTTTSSEGKLIESFVPTDLGGANYLYNVAHAGMTYEETWLYGSGSVDSYPPKGFNNKRWMLIHTDHIFENPPSQIKLNSYQSSGTRTALRSGEEAEPFRIISTITDQEGVKQMIRSHILWDDPKNKHTASWLSLSDLLEDDGTILRERLDRKGLDVMAYRSLMDMSDDKKQEVCSLIVDSAANNPLNADFFYLNTRCMEDGIAQDKEFLKGHRRWPDHAWLALAAGYTYARQGDWQLALNAFEIGVTKEPSLLQIYAKEIERMRRFATAKENIQSESLKNHLFQNEDIAYLDQIENSSLSMIEIPTDQALNLLSQGKLDEALRAIPKGPMETQFKLMVAASKGATEEMITDIFADPGFSQQGGTYALIAMALAKREKQKTDSLQVSFNTAVAQLELEPKEVYQFLQDVQSNKLSKAETYLQSLEHLTVRAMVRMMGVILLQDRVPTDWLLEVKSMLFSIERPYFGT